MAQDDNGGTEITPAASSAVDHRPGDAGTAVVVHDAVENPGFPPHRARITDKDPRKQRRAERTIYTLFYLSIVGSIWAIAAYIAFPIESGKISDLRISTLAIGLGIALALLAIGFGAVHWAKAIMVDKEGIDLRHPVHGSEETRDRAVEIFKEADEESGFGRRTLIRNSLIGALVAFPLPAIVRRLNFAEDTSVAAERRLAHRVMREAMFERMKQRAQASPEYETVYGPMIAEMEKRSAEQQETASADGPFDDPDLAGKSHPSLDFMQDAIDAAREALFALRREGQISDDVRREVEQSLDLQAMQFALRDA